MWVEINKHTVLDRSCSGKPCRADVDYWSTICLPFLHLSSELVRFISTPFQFLFLCWYSEMEFSTLRKKSTWYLNSMVRYDGHRDLRFSLFSEQNN
jgi:hypothetical protein